MIHKKTGLKAREVAKDHFSSRPTSASRNKPVEETKLVIRIIEGSHLLASDIETGKSDPVCFVWCGPKGETPNLEVPIDERESEGIMLTTVCPITIDPRWDEEITFPIDTESLEAIMNMHCLVYVRDEDINEDGTTTYDELGMLDIPLKDIVANGKRMQGNTFIVSATWYALKKTPGMRKAEGDIKCCASLVFGVDASPMFTQINTLKDNKSGAIKEPPKTVGEFTEQLQSVYKSNSRPNSALRTRPLSASDNQSVLSTTTSKRPISANRNKGDGMGKKQIAQKKVKSNTTVVSQRVPVANSGDDMNSIVSNIHQEDMDSVFGGSMLGVIPAGPDVDADEAMDPIMEDVFGESSRNEELDIIPDDEERAPGQATAGVTAADGEEHAPPSVSPLGSPEAGEVTAWLNKMDILPSDVDADPAAEAEAIGRENDAATALKPSDEGMDLVLSRNNSNEHDNPKSYLQAFEKMPKNQEASAKPKSKPSANRYKDGYDNPHVPPGMRRSNQDLLESQGDFEVPPRENSREVQRSNQSRSHYKTAPSTMTSVDGSRDLSKARGHATAAARMLKELSLQRHVFQKGLDDLTELTRDALTKMTARLEEVELRLDSGSGGGSANDNKGGSGKRSSTGNSSSSRAPPRNVRPAGGISEFKKNTLKKLQKTEQLIEERPYGGTSIENVCRTPPGRVLNEINKNKYDPRFHGGIPGEPLQAPPMHTTHEAGGLDTGNVGAPQVPVNGNPSCQSCMNNLSDNPMGNSNNGMGGMGNNSNNIPMGNNNNGMGGMGNNSNNIPMGNSNNGMGGMGNNSNNIPMGNTYNGNLSNSMDWNRLEEQLKYQQDNLLPSDPEQIHNMFEHVLSRGSHDDFVHLLKIVGPKPELLSFGMRSRTFDAISSLLMQGRGIERCLVWVLALVRLKLVVQITQHTQRSLLDGLRKTAMEKSRRGLLAGLLESGINSQCSNVIVGNDFGMMISTSPTKPTALPKMR